MATTHAGDRHSTKEWAVGTRIGGGGFGAGAVEPELAEAVLPYL